MKVTLDNLFTIIAFFTIVPILLLWSRDAWRHFAHHWEPSEEKVIDCPRCHYSFLVRPRRHMAACPACKWQVRVRLAKAKHLKY